MPTENTPKRWKYALAAAIGAAVATIFDSSELGQTIGQFLLGIL